MAQVTEWDGHEASKRTFKNFLDDFQQRFVHQERFTAFSMSYLEDLKTRLENSWEGYSRSHRAIAAFLERQRAEEDALAIDDAFEQEMVTTSATFEDARRSVEQRIAQIRAGEVQVPTTGPSIPRASDVNLPTFSGDYLEFTVFRSAFRERVLREAYPPHAKIDILMRAVTGEARRHLGPVRAQDANELERIWQHLEGTYFNKYLLQRAHIGAIYDQPVLNSESVAGYRAMIGRLTQNMHALAQLGIPTENMDPAILEMVFRKLDPLGTHDWETTRNREQLPTIASFVTFLEGRITVLQNTAIQTTRTNGKNGLQDQRAANHQDGRQPQAGGSNGVSNAGHKRRSANDEPSSGSKRFRNNDGSFAKADYDGRPKPPAKCLMNCNYQRPHHLWLCNAFRALDLDKRVQFINQHKLCRRCLTLRHPIEQCSSPKCSECTDDVHNLALCPRHMVIARANTARPAKPRHGRGKRANPFATSQ